MARRRDRAGHETDDRALLRRLAFGEKQALAALYDRFAERLYSQALWLLRRREDAEDVVQSVFVKIAGMGPELLGIRNPPQYLHRMAHNQSMDFIRLRQRARVLDHTDRDALLLPSPGTTAEAHLEIRNIREAIGRIDAVQRETLYLHLFEQLTFREIGEVIGVSQFTAAGRYRSALKRLRAALSEEST